MQAKFKVREVTAISWSNGKDEEKVTLYAASGPGNEEWSAATPSGKIELSITNKAAWGLLEPGKEYYVYFTEVKNADE